MPHGFCLRWDPHLVFVWNAANAGIAIAYFAIPLALWTFIRKRKDLPYPWMFSLFGLFITSCGVTHCMKIWTIYHGSYWAEALLDLFTAMVSLATAVALWPLIPKALALKSPRELELKNAELQEQINARSKVETELALSENTSRLLLSGIKDYAVSMLDTQGNIMSWNEGAHIFHGFESREVIGKHFSMFFTAEDVNEGKPNVELQAAMKDGRFESECWRLRKDGSRFFANIVLTAIHDENGTVVGFAKVTRDLTEWKKAEAQINEKAELLERTNKQLEIARDRALEASELKSSFVANISHELRTLLSAILGLNELLLNTKLETEQFDFANKIQSAGQSLLSIVNDLLDLSKIEAGKMQLDRVSVNPTELLKDTTKLLQEAAINKGIKLITQVEDGIPSAIVTDPVRLSRVLVNLIGNAIKFTNKGEITVSLEPVNGNGSSESSKLRFTVKDTGIGISEDEKRLLFMPFMQLDQSTTRKYGGTGLGLSISKRLVELMGGEIGLQSQKGRGSTFWFTLPFDLGRQEAQYPPVSSPVAISPAGRSFDHTVLVVEDNQVLQEVVMRQLKSLGIDAYAVTTGEEALEELANRKYRLVLMDCHLPQIDGFEATRRIRQTEKGKDSHITVIAITAGAMKGDQEKCFAAGMDDYLSKPYTLDQLKQKLKEWLSD